MQKVQKNVQSIKLQETYNLHPKSPKKCANISLYQYYKMRLQVACKIYKKCVNVFFFVTCVDIIFKYSKRFRFASSFDK